MLVPASTRPGTGPVRVRGSCPEVRQQTCRRFSVPLSLTTNFVNPAVQHHVLARLLPLPRRAGVMVIAGTQKDLVLKVPGDVSATR